MEIFSYYEKTPLRDTVAALLYVLLSRTSRHVRFSVYKAFLFSEQATTTNLLFLNRYRLIIFHLTLISQYLP